MKIFREIICKKVNFTERDITEELQRKMFRTCLMKSLCSSKKVFSTAFCSITKFGLGLLGDWLDELAASSVIINILDNFANQSLKSVRCCHTKDHLQSGHNYLERTIFTSPVWFYFETFWSVLPTDLIYT